MHKVKVTRVRLFHAGPTSGKTTLMRALKSTGVNVVDTLDILREDVPSSVKEEIWRLVRPYVALVTKGKPVSGQGAESKLASTCEAFADLMGAYVLREVSRRMLADPKLFVVTNIGVGAATFAKFMDPSLLVDGKIPFSAFVVDPTDLHERSLARGDSQGGIPESLASKWISGWKQGAQANYAVAVELKRGEYLADVLDLSAHPLVGPKWAEAVKAAAHAGSGRVITNEIEEDGKAPSPVPGGQRD